MLSYKNVLLILFLINEVSFSQDIFPPPVLNTPDNILTFADFLYCSKDYFRAALEYDRLLLVQPSDTFYLKSGLGYSSSGNFPTARERFKAIIAGTELTKYGILEHYKTFLLEEDIYGLKREIPALDWGDTVLIISKKLLYSGMLLNGELPPADEYRAVFNDNNEMLHFYERKENPGYKNPITAGILSALVPGAGKVYTGHYIDAVFSLLSTGVMVFLAYDNFDAGHDTRAWIFTGLAGFFYAGNIYGAAVSANEFNLGVKAAFNTDLRITLNVLNYFMPHYDFCK